MNFELLGKNLMKNVKNICVENYKTLLRLIIKILNNQKDVQWLWIKIFFAIEWDIYYPYDVWSP